MPEACKIGGLSEIHTLSNQGSHARSSQQDVLGITDQLEHACHADDPQCLGGWSRCYEQAWQGGANHKQIKLVPASHNPN